MLDAIEDAPANLIVSRWVNDNRFVLDYLMSSEAASLPFHSLIEKSRIGVMGMSIGGATATEVAKSDRRIKAAINIDGMQFGTRNRMPLKIPFMMLYSDDGFGNNEFLLLRRQNDFHQIHFRNARHADFSELPTVWPILRVYGQLGRIPAERMNELQNEVILNFWDHYLKQQPLRSLRGNPELDTKLFKN